MINGSENVGDRQQWWYFVVTDVVAVEGDRGIILHRGWILGSFRINYGDILKTGAFWCRECDFSVEDCMGKYKPTYLFPTKNSSILLKVAQAYWPEDELFPKATQKSNQSLLDVLSLFFRQENLSKKSTFPALDGSATQAYQTPWGGNAQLGIEGSILCAICWDIHKIKCGIYQGCCSSQSSPTLLWPPNFKKREYLLLIHR